MRKLSLSAVILLTPLGLFAHDNIVLRDGRTFGGIFLSGTSREITFQDDSGARRRFNVNEIQSINFNDQASRSDNRSGTSNYYRDNNSTSTGNAYRSDRRYAAGTGRYLATLPAGTEIQVRTNQAIDSSTATEGRTYDAVIDRDILDQAGNTVVPRGSDAQLVIRSVSSGGTTGSPDLVLDLQSVMVNGQRYLVNTQDLSQSNKQGIGENRRTAEMVGGGAALGTLLGAVAGGGKGAVIGALAGAAAGGTAQVLTRGKEVKVPAESQLTFRLDQPLRLEAAR